MLQGPATQVLLHVLEECATKQRGDGKSRAKEVYEQFHQEVLGLTRFVKTDAFLNEYQAYLVVSAIIERCDGKPADGMRSYFEPLEQVQLVTYINSCN